MQKIHILFPYTNNPSKNLHLCISRQNSRFRSREDISGEGTESKKLRAYFERPIPFSCRDNLTQDKWGENCISDTSYSTSALAFTQRQAKTCRPDQPSVAICMGSWPYFQLVWLMDWLFHASWHPGPVLSGRASWTRCRRWSCLAVVSWGIHRLLAMGPALLCSAAAHPDKALGRSPPLMGPWPPLPFREAGASLTRTAEVALLTPSTAAF